MIAKQNHPEAQKEIVKGAFIVIGLAGEPLKKPRTRISHLESLSHVYLLVSGHPNHPASEERAVNQETKQDNGDLPTIFFYPRRCGYPCSHGGILVAKSGR
jgi:hypothetical protein